MIIIKTPSIYSCKLPNGPWLNLALIRSLDFAQPEEQGFLPSCIVAWDNGDMEVFKGDDALALVAAWESASEVIGLKEKEEED